MIRGLDQLLDGRGHDGLDELRSELQRVLGAQTASGSVIEQHELPSSASGVYRVRVDIGAHVRSLVIKCLDPAIAWRNRAVITRWLPAVGLASNGPSLLGTAAEGRGKCVWHIYEDFGDQALDARNAKRESVEAAVALIAELHARFVGHVLLPECRLYGGDFGIQFYASSVRDAIRCLELVMPPAVDVTSQEVALRNRLLDRLDQLRDQQAWRAKALAEIGGPETLLHGDLWTTNIFVLPTAVGRQVRLIDWDRAAVGPVSYDLSAFLMRFPLQRRLWISELYRQAMADAGWQLPDAQDLNLLFETAEYARYANCLIWPAMALVREHADWSVETLAEIERWFENLRPVLPEEEFSAAP
jgi:Phosphotransferase enzyme family